MIYCGSYSENGVIVHVLFSNFISLTGVVYNLIRRGFSKRNKNQNEKLKSFEKLLTAKQMLFMKFFSNLILKLKHESIGIKTATQKYTYPSGINFGRGIPIYSSLLAIS